jgi:hypothetical protein
VKKYVVLLCLLFVAGCSVYMNAEYRQLTQAAAIEMAELDRRCGGGDGEACQIGCSTGAETLKLLVDALEGKDPNASR